MKHIAFYRSACLLEESAAESLRLELEIIFGPASPLDRFEEKWKYVPKNDLGNLNFAVQIVEFQYSHDAGDASSRVCYLGSKLLGGLTAVEVSVSPQVRRFFAQSGFKIESDHACLGWRFKTREGVTIDIYKAMNAHVNGEIAWERGEEILPGKVFCELSIKCDPVALPKRKEFIETVFNSHIKRFSSSDLTVIDI